MRLNLQVKPVRSGHEHPDLTEEAHAVETPAEARGAHHRVREVARHVSSPANSDDVAVLDHPSACAPGQRGGVDRAEERWRCHRGRVPDID
jgi:hypothetical protein